VRHLNGSGIARSRKGEIAMKKTRIRIVVLSAILFVIVAGLIAGQLTKNRVDEALVGTWECPASALTLEFCADGNYHYRTPRQTMASGPRYSASNGRLRLDDHQLHVDIDNQGNPRLNEVVPVTYQYTYRLSNDVLLIEQSDSPQKAAGAESPLFSTPIELRRVPGNPGI
jgi:hypothetical protein